MRVLDLARHWMTYIRGDDGIPEADEANAHFDDYYAAHKSVMNARELRWGRFGRPIEPTGRAVRG